MTVDYKKPQFFFLHYKQLFGKPGLAFEKEILKEMSVVL